MYSLHWRRCASVMGQQAHDNIKVDQPTCSGMSVAFQNTAAPRQPSISESQKKRTAVSQCQLCAHRISRDSSRRATASSEGVSVKRSLCSQRPRRKQHKTKTSVHRLPQPAALGHGLESGVALLIERQAQGPGLVTGAPRPLQILAEGPGKKLDSPAHD